MSIFLKLRRALVYALAYEATFRGLTPLGGRPLSADAFKAAEDAGRRAVSDLSWRHR